ncbi:dihydrodipicolinate synthase family protein [bacterium]|nr:dihydrodipicolinate synthase family protein [bacterium]
METTDIRNLLQKGLVIPAHPLALTARRTLDERHQRALSRYYLAAGAGGLAVGVHTTQFAIRTPRIGLFQPVLELAAEEMDRAARPLARIAGICGRTRQAVAEAELARRLGYDAGLVSLAAMKHDTVAGLVSHCRAVADVIPVIGFYLQPAAGGRVLPYAFWRKFSEIRNVVAIKAAPFNRYQTIDVIRAVADARRDDIALYTGNDDNIIMDLLTPYRFGSTVRRFAGGLLGHWAVWTKTAVRLLARCRRTTARGDSVPASLLRLNIEVTDANAAFFDAANNFSGCIAGIHEVLRRQGLLRGTWCLDPRETLGPGQKAEIDRVYKAYPHLNDDMFVARHLDEWLR